MSKKICVYAICKNESNNVEKWLDNVSEADYIVVLDTGSTDGTYEMLKEDPRVTRVEQKVINPWRFDVARNESMKLVPEDADILVCTDFDELFETGWAEVLREAWQEDTTRVFYTYAWSHSETGEPQDVFMYDKIHTRDYRWIYPVHEILEPINKDFKQVAVNVGQHIYLHHFRDANKERGSYFDLLKIAVEEHKEDSHVRMLLAREYAVRHDLDSALKEYLEVLDMPDVSAENKRLVLLASLIQVAIIYQQKANYDEALWYCQEFIKEDCTYREPYLVMADIYNQIHMPTLAEGCINAATKYAYQKYNWVERATTWTYWFYDSAAATYFNLGQVDEAINYVSEALKHAPNDVRLLKNANLFLQRKIALNEEKINTKEAENDK